MLTVWHADAVAEQLILADCMEILDRHSVIPTPMFNTRFPSPDAGAIKITMQAMSMEDLLRIWDALEASYRLSVPYLVRTIRLGAVEEPASPVVEDRVDVYVPALPGGGA